jgi:hypothetical protein
MGAQKRRFLGFSLAPPRRGEDCPSAATAWGRAARLLADPVAAAFTIAGDLTVP